MIREKYLSLIRQHNDIVICNLLDPIEIEPPAEGIYHVTNNQEKSQVAVIDTSRSLTRGKYKDYFQSKQNDLIQIANALNTPVLDIINGQNLLETMLGMFRK